MLGHTPRLSSRTFALIQRAIAGLKMPPDAAPRSSRESHLPDSRQPVALHFEPLEQRLLMSADLMPGVGQNGAPVPVVATQATLPSIGIEMQGGMEGGLQTAASTSAISFVNEFDTDQFSSDLRPLAPAGSWVRAGGVTGTLEAAGEQDSLSINVEAGRSMSLRLRPLGDDSALRARLEVFDAGNQSLGFVEAGQGGDALTLRIAPNAGGALRIDVGSLAGAGEYSVELFLDAALETSDSTGLADAVDLGALLTAVPGGTGSRASVIGRLDPEGATPPFASEDFELEPGGEWSLASSNPDAYLFRSGYYGSGESNYNIGLFSSGDQNGDSPAPSVADVPVMEAVGSYDDNLNEAIWTVDLAGRENLVLEFDQWGNDPIAEAFSGNAFTGSEFADGVAVSVDGENWVPVVSLGVAANGRLHHTIDLSATLAAYGLSPSGQTRLKFQHADAPFSDSENGVFVGYRFWDNISLREAGSIERLQPVATTSEGTAPEGSLNALSDGIAPGEGTYAWESDGSVVWFGDGETLAAPDTALVFDFGASVWLSDLELSVDGNDDYAIDGSLDGQHWTRLADITRDSGEQTQGMETLSTLSGSNEYEASIDFAATQARWLRITGTGGEDNYYAVGEVRAMTTSGQDDSVDWYRIDLAAGDVATLALQFAGNPGTGTRALELYDAAGNLLTTGAVTASGTAAISGFAAPAAGTYHARVSGLRAGEYHLAVTKQVLLGGALSRDEDITATPIVLDGFDAAVAGGASSRIRVAVQHGDSNLLAHLNDSTLGIEAVSVTATDIDTVEELSAYDVVMIGNSSWSSEFQTFASALREWVEGGGGLVATGWTVYGGNQGNASTRADIDAIVPVHTTEGYNYFYGATLDIGDTAHPIVAGLDDFSTSFIYTEYALGGADAGSTTLATAGGRAAVVVADKLAGRSVYLGPAYADYSGSINAGLDQLLEQAVAWAAGDSRHDHRLRANAGDVLTLTAEPIGTAAGQPANTLVPRLELIDADATVVASSTTGSLSYTVAEGGRYTIRLGAESGQGDVLLRVTGSTAGATDVFDVAHSSIDGLSRSVSFPEFVDIDFTEPLLLTSLSAGSLTVNGAAAHSFSVLGASRVRFFVGDLATADGTYTFALGDGTLTDIHGQPLAGWTRSVELDTTLPVVTASSIAQQGHVEGAPAVLVIAFSEALDTSYLDSNDVWLIDEATGDRIAVTSFAYDAGTFQLQLGLPALTDGRYSLRLVSGFSAFKDLLGMPLNGDPSDPLPSGGTDNTADDFVLSFVVDPATRGLGALAELAPAGSLVQGQFATGGLNGVDDIDSFTLTLGTDQLLTVFARPTGTAAAESGLRIGLSVFDANAQLVASIEGAAGDGVALQTLRAAGGGYLAAGTYRVDLTNLAGDGNYEVGVLLGARTEAESAGIGAANDITNNEVANAENIDSSFIALGNGGSRGAVVGSLAVPAANQGGGEPLQALDADAAGDHYRFTLGADQYATVVLASALGSALEGTLVVDLLDADGTLLATSEATRSSTVQAIRDFKSGAAGEYVLRVHGSSESLYNLTITRSLAFELSPADNTTVLQDISATHQVLGHLTTSGGDGSGNGSAATRVAVFNGGGGNALVAQLNDDTWFDFTAVSVTADQIDTLEELRQFDAVVIGDSNSTQQYDSFAGALRQWVEEGGGLVATGWTIFAAGASTAPVLPDIDAIVPVNTSVGYSYMYGGTVDVLDSVHAATEGLSDFYVGSYIEYSSGGVDPGSQTLATVNGQAFVVVGQPGNGRSAYLGAVYYHGYPGNNASLDRLLEQTVSWAAGDRDDSYALQVGAGDELTISTRTPGGADAADSTLAVRLELYDATGALVASNAGGAADGHNAVLTYAATTGGSYRVRVIAEGGRGAYLIAVEGATAGAAASAPVITTVTPASGAILSVPPTEIVVELSEGVLATSVSADDLVLDGAGTVTGVEMLAGNRLRFLVELSAIDGAFGFHFADGAFTDLQGTASEAFSSSFVFDLGGPSVVSAVPSGDAAAPLTNWVFTFDEAIDASSVGIDDVAVFTGPAGQNLRGVIQSVTASGNTLTVNFVAQYAPGAYVMVLGPGVRDLAGNAMDQDGDGIANESTDDRYTAELTLRSPDLVPTALTVPTSATFGTPFTVTWTVHNAGNGPTGANGWYDSFWLSRDDVLGGDDIRLSDQYIANGAVAADGSYTRTAALNVQLNTAFLAGSYHLLLHTDYYGQQGESDESNNRLASAAFDFVVPALPDLVTEKVQADAVVEAGKQTTITWTVRNQGTAATASVWYDNIYLSSDTLFGNGDTRIGEIYNNTAIAAGATLDRSATVTVPTNLTGQWYVIVRGDGYDYVEEFLNEGNNDAVSATRMNVIVPTEDLVPSGVSAPAAADFGDKITVAWTVSNKGTGPTATNWVDRLWLSTDDVLGSDDVMLGDFASNGDTPLPADGQYIRSRDITLPLLGNLNTGNYRVLVQTDPGNSEPETNESNNLAASGLIALTVPPFADLTVADVRVPANVHSGETVTIRFTLRNQGDVAASDFYYDLALTDSNVPGSSDYNLGSFLFNDTLSAGESVEISQDVTLPISAPGNWYVGVRVDSSNNIFEHAAEGNNAALSALTSIPLPPLADLRVTDIVAPAQALAGQIVPITWTVKNQGTGSIAGGQWTDRIYLSSNDGASDNIYVGDFTYEGDLAAGASVTRTQTITLPADQVGNYAVVVRTDIYGNVYEYDGESNNRTVDNTRIGVTFPPLANLTVSSITPPSDAFSGTSTVVSWVVTNAGTGSTSAPFWADSVVLSLNDVFGDGDDIALGQVANPSYLAAGDSYVNSLTFTVPRGLAGDYRLLVKTDVNGNVFENTFEGDNLGVSALTHFTLTPPPDLRVTAVQAPAQAFSGQPVNLNWTVANAGEGRTLETAWVDRVYVSIDSVFDSGDLVLGSFQHNGALDAQATYTTTQSVTLPVGQVGERWFFVVTDVLNNVYEHASENNNSGGDPTATNVLLTPPPDLEVDSITLPATVRAGNVLNFQYGVRNFGATATAESYWIDNFYLSTDQTLDARDVLIGTQGHGGVLGVDESYGGSPGFVLPNTLSGSLYLIVHTDAGDAVFEGFAGSGGDPNANNIAVSAAPVVVDLRPADLVIDSFVAPAAGEAGKPVAFTWTLRNAGTGATQASFWIDQVVASNDAILGDDDDIVLGSTSPGDVLAAGASFTQTLLVSLPFGLEGNYTLFLRTDANNQVFEGAGESGNTASLAFSVRRDTPDLQVTTLGAVAPAAFGEPLTVSWRVENKGANATNSNYWYDRVWLSRDATLSSGDIALGNVFHGNPLASGEGYDASASFVLPAGFAPGEYHVIVETDAYGYVTEGSAGDANNARAAADTVTIMPGVLAPVLQPDLRVDSVVAAADAISGQSTRVTWTVRNDSADPAGNTRWYDAVYLSRDLVFDRNTDLYLGYADHDGGLAAGASYTRTQGFDVPYGQSGPFYVFVVADSGRAMPERVETNNTGFDDSFVQVSLAPPADLLVGDITIPVNAIPGKDATLTYTVNNQGSNPALGSWRDSIYLSADEHWDIGDVLFGSVVHSGTVAGGSSYTESLSAALPGVTPGSYHVIVRSDILNAVPESNESNNLSASLDAVAIDVEALALGTPSSGSLASGQAVFYKIVVAAGETVRVVLQSEGDENNNASGVGNELYLRYGSMPTRGQFDESGRDPFVADQLAVIPTTQAGTYYVMLYGAAGPAARAYTLTASVLPFSLQSVDQSVIGNGGPVTLQIDGAKFDASTRFALVNAAGDNVAADAVVLADSSRAFVTFDVRGADLGGYTLGAVTGEGTVAQYAEPITVVAGSGADIAVRIDGPAQVRPGRVVLANLVYTNQGDADTMAPLFIVTSPTGTAFGSSAESVGLSSSVQLLGIASNGPQDILRPGDGNSLPLLFQAVNAPMRFSTRTIEASSTEALDYSLLEHSLRMPGMSDSAWQTRWLTQIQPRLGGTWGNYVRLVNTLSEQFSTAERTIFDVRELFDLAFHDDADFLVSTSIEGSLGHADDGHALAGIQVAAFRQVGEGYELAGSGVTDANGAFAIRYLQPGTYVLALGGITTTGSDGVEGVSSPYLFDMNRDGKEDADSPRITLTHDADKTGLQLFARPEAPVVASDNDPAIATDAEGRLHMVWMRDGALWHAVDDGSGWQHAAPLPAEANGTQVQLLADPRLIDGNSEGLLATWRNGEANASEIMFSVGRREADGSYRWTTPALLTDNAWFDGAYSVAVGADGKPVFVGQRSDLNSADDIDLYSSELSLDGVQWADTLAEFLQKVVDANTQPADDAELDPSTVVRYRWAYKIGRDVPLWKKLEAEFRIDFRGQLGCTLILAGNGALRIKIGEVEVEGRLGGDLRFTANHETCTYEFDGGRINFQAAAAFNPPMTSLALLIPEGYPALWLADQLGFSLRMEVAVGGRLTWKAGDDFTWDAADKTGTFRLSGGVEFQSKVWFGGDIKARVLINSNWLFGGPEGFRPADQPLTVSGLLRWPAPWGGWRELTFTYPGNGEAPLGGDLLDFEQWLAMAASDVDVSTTYGYSTPEAFGTLNDYGSAGEQQLTDNLTNESEPAIAETTDGKLWLAYGAGEGGIAVSARQGGAWLPGETIPGSAVAGQTIGQVALAADGQGDLIAVWSLFDGSGLSDASTSAQVQAAFSRGNELMFARRSAATGAWSTPQALSPRNGDDHDVVLERLANGDVVAAWIGADPDTAKAGTATLFAMRYAVATGTWSAAQAVATGANIIRVQAGERAGTAVLMWSQTLGGGAVIRSAAWSGDGFGAAATVQIALEASLVDVTTASTVGETSAADADGALQPSSIIPWTPPDECCDEPPDPPYDPKPVVPRDPNDIIGPAGFGDERWVAASDTLAYTIRFENASDAAAPAQEVVVTQQLDADLDWRTFRVDDFGFGDQRVVLDGKTAFYQQRIDLSETKGYLLDVSASIDTATGLVTWKLTTLDPATGELPLDAQLGFLPPNKDAEGNKDGRGEGFLSYTIKAKRTVTSGTVIDATARIVFDTEEPIDTPPIANTLDAGLPTSQVTALPATTDDPIFLVSWAGSDAEGGSALASYTVYVSINGAAYVSWLSDTTLTEALYEGDAGNTYTFYSVARDNAGNVEPLPEVADTRITVGAGFGSVAGAVFDDSDGDGSRDAGETGLAGWAMFIDADADGVFDDGERSTVTDADGHYRFDAVGAGSVTIGRVLQSGWQATAPTDNRQVVDVVANQTAEGADFGSFRRASIGGVAFDDANANGVRDSGEALLAGWTIQLDRNGDGSIEATTATATDGSFRFDDLGPGSYRLIEVAQSGWLRTTPGSFGVLATSGLNSSAVAFGSVRPASIAGVKFEDVDGDGQRDEGEGLLAGWTIFLDADADGTLDAGERSVVTGADGSYRFDDLLPGSYTVAEVMQAGWMQTAPSTSTGSASLDPLTGSAQELELPDAGLDSTALASSATTGNAWADMLTGLDAFRADNRFAGIDGSGLSVVVIDTGIDLDHAFFGPDADGDGVADRIVFQYDFAGDDADASDHNNHGSHTASVIGAADATYGGVAQGVDLIALKVFQDGGKGYFSYLENALRWVVAHADEFNVGVVNLSLGDGGNWNTAIGRFGLADELAALAAKNIIVTAASGNNFAKVGGAWGVAYPAADPAVLAVGATWAADLGGPWNFSGGSSDYTTGADRIASFSQRDDELLDVFAPGARLTGANASGGTTTMQGTSQASAYMAGVAALAQDLAQQTLGRRLSLTEFTTLLDATSHRIVDGDDENDNVRNSGLAFQRVDMLALAEAILAMPAGGGSEPGGGAGGGAGNGSVLPSAGPAVHSITVAAGGAATGADFGNFRLGRIDGTLFHDADADGVRDVGEAGLGGFTVFIDANGNGTADTGEASTVTDASGAFSFTDLGPGARTLVLAERAGWKTLTGEAAVTVTSGSVATPALSVNALPTLDAIGDANVDEGREVNVTLAGHDSTGEVLRYELVGSVPAGASLGAESGVLSWTPADGAGTQAFTVRVTDSAGSFAERSFSVQVANVAPTLTATGAAAATTGQPYALALSSSDPGADTIDHWTIDWGDGIVQTVNGNPASVSHSYAAAGRYAIAATAADEDGSYAVAGPTVAVVAAHVPLQVTAFAATGTGFVVRFNQVVDAGNLNVYDAASHNRGASDIVFANAAGQPVAGSVVLDADGRGLTFVKTGGLLAAGAYSLRLASGTTAFADLDGNGDGTAGDAYIANVQAMTDGAVLSIGEIARGPGQPIDLPATGGGFPITIAHAAGATRIEFTLRYDARLIGVSGVTNGAGLPTGSSLLADLSVAGEVRVVITTGAPLGAAALELVRLQSTVRATAAYGASQVLDLTAISVNGGAMPVRDDDGLHVVAYLGDTSGDKGYSALDVERLQRVLTRADSGFGAFPLTDPTLLGDINASGTLTSLDAARLQQQVNGQNRPEIPAIPTLPIATIVPAAPAAVLELKMDLSASYGNFELAQTPNSQWIAGWLADAPPPHSIVPKAGTPLLRLLPASVAPSALPSLD